MLKSRFIVGVAALGLIAGAAVSAQQKKAAPKTAPAKGAAAAPAGPAGPVIVFNFVRGLGSSKQVLGTVEIETLPGDAPKSSAHVVDLVKAHFYNGIRVHWSTAALMQFGDPLSKDMTKKDQWGTGGSDKAVGVAEAGMAKHKFERGIVGLAYRNGYDPKTADSQLVVIKGSNSAMNGKYAVVGKVTEQSMKVVDKLEVGDRIESSSVK